MKKILFFTSLFLTDAAINAGNNKISIPDAYFRQISFDSKLAFVGKYAVDEKNSKETNCYHFKYNSSGNLVIVEYLAGGKLQRDLALGVAQVKIDYRDGYEKRTYYNETGKPECDMVSNVNSVRIRYDNSTHLLSLFNYNKKGSLTKDKYNVVEYAWLLDSEGKRIKSMHMDRTGTRIVDKDGFYELRAKYDDKGNITELANYGKDGRLLESKGKVSILHKKYDDKGNILEEASMTAKGELMDHHITHVAVTQLKYDDNGNIIETKYLGSDEQLKEDCSGIALTKWKYDTAGNLIEESYFGIDEQPKERRVGENLTYAVVRWKYDSQGNLIRTIYLNKKQASALTASAN